MQLKMFIRRLAEKKYSIAKMLWKRGQRKQMQSYSGHPIINYQMGKVGSSTIQASLDKLGLDQPVYHVHFLNPVRVREIEQQRFRYFHTDKHKRLWRPWLSEFLYEEINRKNRRWKLITLVREPIGRNISTFFENLEVQNTPGSMLYRIKSDYYGFEIDIQLDQVEPLVELFFDRLAHNRPLDYFDDEIKSVFGVDVFDAPFPSEKGYKIVSGNEADLLLIKLNQLNQCASEAFREFLGIDDFTLIHTNVGSEKIYAPLYRAFKERICIPEAYMDKMYNSKYSQYFFSDAEIRPLRERWAGITGGENAGK